VEISPNANPPVCRVLDYGKYKYEQAKKAHDAKKKQTVIQVKEVKFRLNTDDHDHDTKVRHIRSFLEEGKKAKVTMFFRGREIVHNDIGRKTLERIAEQLTDIALVEQEPRFEGRAMFMMLAPRRRQ
jgi:translation initiation factor IF-3